MKIGCGLRWQAMLLTRLVKRRVRLQGDEGTALVELAIAVPILMMLLTGAASFALGFYSLQQLGNATANATQYEAAQQGISTNPCTDIVTQITTTLPSWTASKFSYSISITDSSGTAHLFPTTAGSMDSGSAFTCASLASDEAQNEPITVTVSYTYSWLPVFRFTPSSALTSTDTVMAE
jgi:Flp pilus assembly protein TadG